jgi:erythromycin esterase
MIAWKSKISIPVCLVFLLAGCGGGSGGAGGSGTPPQTDSRTQWVSYIKANAKLLRTIDPLDANYSDLSFLDGYLQGRDIVELGESGHGVAEFSQAKIRLIKYLHEQMGYDILAFESSILSTYLSNEQASQWTPTEFMQNSIFAVWSTTDVQELFSYIQSTQGTAHPLILAGFDVQLTTPYEWQARPGLFQEVVEKIDPVYAQQVRDMDQGFIQGYETTFGGNYDYILTSYADLKAKYQALTSFLDANQAQIQASYASRPRFPAVVRQAAWGMSAFLDELYNSALGTSAGTATANADRDAGMAVNLELLIDNLYTGKKFMVWAHNGHIMHDGAIYTQVGWQNMGNWIFQKYGNRVYTLGLYMYQGNACSSGGGVCGGLYTINPAAQDSVEGLLHTANDAFVFLDITTAPSVGDATSWMSSTYPIREWGTQGGAMSIKSEYDGLLQIDTVHPPTYVPY